jgi:hypothetical protein
MIWFIQYITWRNDQFNWADHGTNRNGNQGITNFMAPLVIYNGYLPYKGQIIWKSHQKGEEYLGPDHASMLRQH